MICSRKTKINFRENFENENFRCNPISESKLILVWIFLNFTYHLHTSASTAAKYCNSIFSGVFIIIIVKVYFR
jgi:hypothetical protein